MRNFYASSLKFNFLNVIHLFLPTFPTFFNHQKDYFKKKIVRTFMHVQFW